MSTAATQRGIVVGVDGSPNSLIAVDWAAHEAALRKVPLNVVNVLNPWSAPTIRGVPMPMPPSYTRLEQEERSKFLSDAVKAVEVCTRQVGPIDTSSELMIGPPVMTLVELSRDAELVVVGRHGLGAIARALLGSVSNALIHHAHCPIAVIPESDSSIPHPAKAPVLLGIDGTPASESATAIAFNEASWRGVELVALHAWSDTTLFGLRTPDWSRLEADAKELLAERLAGWQERFPDVVVHRVLVNDRPAQQLLEQSRSAKLVVVGSHGRGGFTGMLLGSVSTAVAHHAQTPVIIARRP